MKRGTKFFVLVFATFFFTTDILYPQEKIGISWEFNEDNNFEGWEINANFDSFKVENGVLSVVAIGAFPSLRSSAFVLPAAEYGYVHIRMKTPGASSAIVRWDLDTNDWGWNQFPIYGDTLFHEYKLPLYSNNKWHDNLIKIQSFVIHTPLNAKVEVDYFRFVHAGPIPEVTRFKAWRTIFKPGEVIPLLATLKNSGDEPVSIQSELILPEGATLLQGQTQAEHGEMYGEMLDSLEWQIRFEQTGNYDLTLNLITETDTIPSILNMPVTEEYWVQDEFLLSAWSPPYAWYPPPYQQAVVDTYAHANFDVALWARPEDDLTQLFENIGMKYFILITNILGGDPYLREPEGDVAPELTPEMLARLDPIIEKYRNNPNVIGYHICDEPYDVTFPNIGKVVRYIRERDPKRLCFVNIWPGDSSTKYRTFIEDMLDETRLEHLSYDRYVFYNTYDGGSFFSNIRVVREFALRYDVPFFNIIQAIGTNGTVESGLDWRTPTEGEHRWQAYASLAYGVRGLIWFHWHGNWGVTGNPDREKIIASLTKINPGIKAVGQEMLELNLHSISATHTKPKVGDEAEFPNDPIISSVSPDADLLLGFFKNDTDNDFVMVMNKDYRDSVTALVYSDYQLPELRVFNAEAVQWETAATKNENSGSYFEVTLEPGGGKLFEIGQKIVVGVQQTKELPASAQLFQNYPNPFNPETKITYETGTATRVQLTIYDILGREIEVLVDEQQSPGLHTVNWSAHHLANGLYFYKLSTGQHKFIRKMLYLQ
ncbi:MAG: T9SS type A sorting domain-containing protein [Deferribacteres bacterium]|nr:T9SS type A sorting domain-containing protein [candidate division KSB1 bacterium]MCB9501180.1 T9SS type A sorting domain-containing protein [Deferribacteres bacterium]